MEPHPLAFEARVRLRTREASGADGEMKKAEDASSDVKNPGHLSFVCSRFSPLDNGAHYARNNLYNRSR